MPVWARTQLRFDVFEKFLKLTQKSQWKTEFYLFSLPSSRIFSFLHLCNIPKFLGLVWGYFRRAWAIFSRLGSGLYKPLYSLIGYHSPKTFAQLAVFRIIFIYFGILNHISNRIFAFSWMHSLLCILIICRRFETKDKTSVIFQKLACPF